MTPIHPNIRTVQHCVYAELGDGEDVYLPIREGGDHVFLVEFPRRLCLPIVAAELQPETVLLILAQEGCAVWVIGKQEVCGDTESHTGYSLDDHDPAPTRHALNTIHLTDAVGEQS